MAAALVPLVSLVIPLVSQFLPSIVQLFQHAHPIPADAPPAVKADLNTLKATGALQAATVLVNQLAASGKIPANTSDPTVLAGLAGAIEQTYQQLKLDGKLNDPPAVPGAISLPGAFSLALKPGQKIEVSA